MTTTATTNLKVLSRLSSYATPIPCGHTHRTLSGALRCGRHMLAAVSADRRSGRNYHRGPVEIEGTLDGAAIEPLDVGAYDAGYADIVYADVDADED